MKFGYNLLRQYFVTLLSASLSDWMHQYLWVILFISLAINTLDTFFKIQKFHCHRMDNVTCIFQHIQVVTTLSAQYLTPIFSKYDPIDPFYKWKELQLDISYSFPVLRIIIQTLWKIPCYTIIQNLAKFLFHYLNLKKWLKDFVTKLSIFNILT